MAAARAGALADAEVEPPRALRPLLDFARLRGPALATVRRVLDEDEGFRRRIAAAAEDVGGEEVLGRPAWLFLARPPGWEEELAGLAGARQDLASADREEREERTARRRLRGAEEAARRAAERASAAEAGLAAAAQEAAAERRARREAEAQLEALQARVASLERERDAAHRRSSESAKELARLSAALEEARRAASGAGPAGPAASGPTGPAGGGVVPGGAGPAGGGVAPGGAGPAGGAAAAPGGAGDPRAAAGGASVDPAALEEVRAAVEQAAAAASGLGAALAAAAAALGPRPPAAGEAAPVPEPPLRERRPRPRRAPGRLPVPLPPGLMEDAPEVAAFLVRVPGLVLVVDGYNASLRRWPGRPIADQRQRLVDALAALSARTGGDVHVVFDGTGSEGRSLALPRRGVRVTFTPADVEADDAILELVDQAPPGRPVAVASDDRRVRREAAARGANALSQEQLFVALHLEP